MSPDEADQEWLLDALRTLVRRHGAARLLDAALLEPTDQFFPDRWDGDRPSVQRILQRLLAYAGLPTITARVTIEHRDAPPPWVGAHSDTPAWFAGIAGGVAQFGCVDSHFEQPDVLVAHLCHEVAHAWRCHHRAVQADPEVEERLTDVTTVYLGFGVFTANASFTQRHSGQGTQGRVHYHRSGYLRAPHFAYLLAAQAVARDLGWCARRRLGQQLGPDQRTMFNAWYRRLLLPDGRLKRRIGLTSFDAPGPP